MSIYTTKFVVIDDALVVVPSQCATYRLGVYDVRVPYNLDRLDMLRLSPRSL